MKLSSAIILASVGAASAFTATPASKAATTALRMSDNLDGEERVMNEVSNTIPEVPVSPEMSPALPFMERPAALDGSLAGDVGFDPFGFAKSKEDLMNYREAEVKHARLAMLAAAGWPISELFDRPIANTVGLDPIVDAQDRAPSVLNGGLGKISPIYWVVCLAAAAAIDLYGINRSKKVSDYTPGDLGFDPFGVFPKDPEGQEWFKTAEIKNGRLAMLGITGFAFQEFAWQQGVINETPIFFKPLGEALHQAANAGYIQ